MSLLKIDGREVVTVDGQATRLVWVEDTIVPPVLPPETPPINPPPTTPPIYVPFVGSAFIPCVGANGQTGVMMVTNNADGTTTRRSGCIISEGLS